MKRTRQRFDRPE
jgi:hypothetical protein